jgi:HAD superfamily hydrolase (TIGR01549 family)
MKYTHVFFDWDGTLAQTLEVWIKAKQEVFAEYGINLTRHEVGETLGDLTAHGDQFGLDIVEFDQQLLVKVEEGLEDVPLYDGGKELLAALNANGIKIAILTTNTRQRLNYDIKRLGVDGYIDYTLTADEVAEHKPKPDIILRAVDYFGADLHQVLMIGDSSKDLGAARAAGVDVALFHHPDLHGEFYDIDYLTKTFNPTYVVDDLGSLFAIIKEGISETN